VGGLAGSGGQIARVTGMTTIPVGKKTGAAPITSKPISEPSGHRGVLHPASIKAAPTASATRIASPPLRIGRAS
jgi:hypothetical protein